MPSPTNACTKIVLAKSGRWAILARETPHDLWVQVESAISEEMAKSLADQLEGDLDGRHGYIYDNEDVDWGDDAPEG